VTDTHDNPPPSKVLLVKPSALGDVVTALPVLRGLRRTVPEARLSWLVATSCQALLEGDPDLDEIIPFDRKTLGRWWHDPRAGAALWRFYRQLRGGGFDWVLDLQGLFRSGLFTHWTRAPLRAGFADAREGGQWFCNHRVSVTAEHTVDRNIELARALGVDARPEDFRLHVSDAGRAFAEEFRAARSLPTRGYLVLVPPTRWPTKIYPVRHWRRVARDLSETLPVVLVGSPAEQERRLCAAIAKGLGPRVIDLAGQTALPQLVGLIADAAGVIGSDSAAKFIAPAVGVGCITLIGPTRVERTGPYRGGTAITAEVACQGCLQKRCSHITCMESIPPSGVVRAAHAMIAAHA
jgi:heptosyltransferase-1